MTAGVGKTAAMQDIYGKTWLRTSNHDFANPNNPVEKKQRKNGEVKWAKRFESPTDEKCRNDESCRGERAQTKIVQGEQKVRGHSFKGVMAQVLDGVVYPKEPATREYLLRD